MAEGKKGWGGTVLGWFVEFDESKNPPPTPPPAKGSAPAAGGDDADDLIRRYASDSGAPAGKAPPPKRPLDQSPAKSPSGEMPPDFGAPSAAPAMPSTPGEPIDFDPVFKSAGIGDAERDKVKKALELLGALPAETPLPVKKQIVETSLKTFGVSIDAIIETAVAEIQALHGAITAGAGEAAKLQSESQARITKLEQQINDVKQVVYQKQQEQASLEGQARNYGLRVQQILEFFGQEKVGQVVAESPRLKDPTGAKPAAPPAKKK